MLFDTHAHLDDEQLFVDLDAVLSDARCHQVESVVTIATSLESSYRCIKIAERHESVYASVGIHPNSAHQASQRQWKEIKQLVGHPKVVAIGETGLDGYWDYCSMDVQRDYFARHIELSHQSGSPFIVHMRDCEQEMLEALHQATKEGKLNGIMHSFCGSMNAAQRCLEWGMYISFAGMVTYKKNDELRVIAAEIPADRLLIETDSPYLSPHPKRGVRPNTPALVRFTAECLAKVRGVSTDELAQQTTENAKRIFGLD